jgi:hypothetical protein
LEASQSVTLCGSVICMMFNIGHLWVILSVGRGLTRFFFDDFWPAGGHTAQGTPLEMQLLTYTSQRLSGGDVLDAARRRQKRYLGLGL